MADNARDRHGGLLDLNAEALRAVIDHIPYRVFWKDRQSRYLGVNAPFAGDAGFENPDDLIGLDDYDMPWSKEESDFFRECDRRVMESGEAELHIVEPQRRSDGSETWLETSKVPLRNGAGEIVGVLGTYLDITHQIEAKKELERARDEAIRANEVKSNFIATISHEVRTPMAAVLGFAELIEQEINAHGAKSNAEIVDHLETIRRNGQHLLAIINDVLDLAKLEAGRFDTERVRTPIPETLKDVLAIATVRAEGRPVHVSLELEGPIPEYIVSDPVRLRQILVNLAGNAVKFTERGSVRLRVGTPDAGGRTVRFEIVDTGPGIPRDRVESIFEPFTQVDDFQSRRVQGTGLGLAISRQLAEAMGGELSCESVVGEGSTFALTLPVGETDVPRIRSIERRAPDATEIRDGSSMLMGRVLLAEDSPDNARLLTAHLKRLGLEVTHAGNGRIAIERIDEADEPFHLVLMDVQMPEIDGLEATRRLREGGYTGRVYALTAHALATHHDACVQAGCDKVLTKPISFGALRSEIEACFTTRPGSAAA